MCLRLPRVPFLGGEGTGSSLLNDSGDLKAAGWLLLLATGGAYLNSKQTTHEAFSLANHLPLLRLALYVPSMCVHLRLRVCALAC